MSEEVHKFGSATSDEPLPDAVKRAEVSDDSVLADLIAEAGREIEEVKWYPIPNRPSISLGFSTQIDYDTLRMWFKRATDRKKKDLKTMTLCAIVMSNQTRGVRINGNPVVVDGEELLLSDERLWDVFKARSVIQCLKNMYVSEGHVISAMQEIISDAGYGDVDVEADDEDPLAQG